MASVWNHETTGRSRQAPTNSSCTDATLSSMPTCRPESGPRTSLSSLSFLTLSLWVGRKRVIGCCLYLPERQQHQNLSRNLSSTTVVSTIKLNLENTPDGAAGRSTTLLVENSTSVDSKMVCVSMHRLHYKRMISMKRVWTRGCGYKWTQRTMERPLFLISPFTTVGFQNKWFVFWEMFRYSGTLDDSLQRVASLYPCQDQQC